MTIGFSDRLCAAIKQKQTPLVVGLDPRSNRLPPSFASLVESKSLDSIASAYTNFCCEIVDAVKDLVPAVKPQAAFFEQLGPTGMVALGKVVTYAKSAGLLVIMDAKRGDIGSTAEAYAAGFLGPDSPWGCDALTVNPYLGDDSLVPFADAAKKTASGIFVLAKTSNPGSNMLQELQFDKQPLYSIVANHLQQLAKESAGESGYGAVGAVVGATHPKQLSELRKQLPNVIFLVPGLGAQGGTAADVAGGFDENGFGAVVNSSRAIIFAHENEKYAGVGDWQHCVEQATKDTIDQLSAETNAGQLKA